MHAAVLLSALAAAVSPAAALPRSGVAGTVSRGPIAPVCNADSPCDGPAAGTPVLVVRGTRVVARTTTDALGRYHAALAPGRYVLLAPRAGMRQCSTAAVVAAGRWTRVDLVCDTGIR